MHAVFAIKTICQHGGGAERVLGTVVSGMVESGARVTLVTHDPPEAEPFYGLPNAVNWVRIPIGETGRSTSLVNLLARVPALRREIRRLRPDVVVAFMHSMYVPMALAMVGSDVPLIGSEHTAREHYRSRPVEYLLANVAALRTAYVTVVSERIRREYGPLLRTRMVPIGNPVLLPDPPDRGRERSPIILSVGRLGPEKDHATLIRAFALLPERNFKWKLRIVGEGEERSSLERLVDELSLRDRVEMPGAVGQIEREYQQAAVFVTPSRYESFGMATIEAMATGLPVVGFSDCPGTNEVIVDGVNGLLVDSEHRVSALATALGRLIESPSVREKLGDQARKNVQRYSARTILGDWHELIAGCVEKTK